MSMGCRNQALRLTVKKTGFLAEFICAKIKDGDKMRPGQ